MPDHATYPDGRPVQLGDVVRFPAGTEGRVTRLSSHESGDHFLYAKFEGSDEPSGPINVTRRVTLVRRAGEPEATAYDPSNPVMDWTTAQHPPGKFETFDADTGEKLTPVFYIDPVNGIVGRYVTYENDGKTLWALDGNAKNGKVARVLEKRRVRLVELPETEAA